MTTTNNNYSANTATSTNFVILQLLLPQLLATSVVSFYTNMTMREETMKMMMRTNSDPARKKGR